MGGSDQAQSKLIEDGLNEKRDLSGSLFFVLITKVSFKELQFHIHYMIWIGMIL